MWIDSKFSASTQYQVIVSWAFDRAATFRTTVGGVLDALTAGYYEPRRVGADLDERLFLAVPSQGASFTALET